MDLATTAALSELDEETRGGIIRVLASDSQDLGLLLYELAGFAIAEGKTKLANWLFNAAYNQEVARGRSGGHVAVASLRQLAETSLKIDDGDALLWSRRLREVAPDDETHGLAERFRRRAVKAINRRAARPESALPSFSSSSIYEVTKFEPTCARFSFKDVGGLGPAKDALQRLAILPHKHPESAKRFGIEMGGGVLLYGPPGCGKTLIAEAAAGEMGVPIFKLKAADIMHPLYGMAERNLAQAFKAARESAPCVLFIDEIDDLARRRDINPLGHTVVNTLLAEMGESSTNDGVLLIGATNQISRIDIAVLRPGRFNKLVEVPLPDDQARAAIWCGLLDTLPCSSGVATDILVSLSDGLSGADIAEVTRTATEAAWTQSLHEGSDREVGMGDLLIALRGGFVDGAAKHRIDELLAIDLRNQISE